MQTNKEGSTAPPRPPAPEPERTAFFLDFDGTLADIADDPSAVTLPGTTREALARLSERSDGALAIVSGRAIEDIDRLVAPLVLPVAGVHGLHRRSHDGRIEEQQTDKALFLEIQSRLGGLAARTERTMLEVKPGSLALHYRLRPDLAPRLADMIHELLHDLEGFDILHGKMVVEIKTGHADKGQAIEAFMAEAPFSARLPLVAGDDVTDEDAFRAVGRLGGVTVKIGDGPSVAAYRLPDPAAFRRWIEYLAQS